jgi:hypothetical protein
MIPIKKNTVKIPKKHWWAGSHRPALTIRAVAVCGSH